MIFTFSQPQTFAEGPRPSDQIAKLAALLEPRMRRAFLQAVSALGNGIGLRRLEQALLLGNVSTVLSLLPFNTFESALLVNLTPALQAAMNNGGQYGSARFSLRFDMKNPQALKWIERHGAELVRGITDQSRIAIREILQAGYRDGLTPARMAKQIKSHIGLNEGQARAVLNYRRGLIQRELKDGQVDSLAEKYAARLLRQRAKTIAVNESLVAAHEGKRIAWSMAADKGLLNPATTRKKWLPSLSPCARICASMAGQVVGLFDSFVTGLGELIEGPPSHTLCRCDEGLVFA